jgi:hypothetical protein
LIALSRLAGRRGRLVDFVRLLGLEADRIIIDVGGDSQVGNPDNALVHVTDTARMHVSKMLLPNDMKSLMDQVVDFPNDIVIRVVEDGD